MATASITNSDTSRKLHTNTPSAKQNPWLNSIINNLRRNTNPKLAECFINSVKHHATFYDKLYKDIIIPLYAHTQRNLENKALINIIRQEIYAVIVSCIENKIKDSSKSLEKFIASTLNKELFIEYKKNVKSSFLSNFGYSTRDLFSDIIKNLKALEKMSSGKKTGVKKQVTFNPKVDVIEVKKPPLKQKHEDSPKTSSTVFRKCKDLFFGNGKFTSRTHHNSHHPRKCFNTIFGSSASSERDERSYTRARTLGFGYIRR